MSRANFHASRLDVPLSLRRRDNIAAIVVHIGAVTQEIVRMREFQIKTFLFFQMMSTFHFMKELTGCDFVVMATLASQQGTALALRLEMLEIETQGLKDLVFTCRHGIHRSVGCACLLVMLFYPEAKLVFHKDRAMEAAWG